MARKKKVLKAKEPVKIRFKQLANGNQSIYLDTYKDGVRKYEFIKNMFIIPEVDEASKVANQNTLNKVNAIKSQRIIDIQNETANISKASIKSKMLLVEYLEMYKDVKLTKGRSDANAKIIEKMTKYLVKYKGNKITLKQVDKDYCLGFIMFLQTTRTKSGKRLAQNTARNYYKVFNASLNYAVKHQYIENNPFDKIDADDKIKAQESTRKYLDVEDVKKLMATPCKNDMVKRAFLFSCFTGLRCSDVLDLTWGMIKESDGRLVVTKTIIKTNHPWSSTLSEQAQRCLPSVEAPTSNAKVFPMPESNYHNVVLKEWARDAEVDNDISFHVARHTFATLGITADVDLYVVSKLLGHTQIKTTQIYAKVMDKKKDEGVNAVSNLF